MKTKKKTLRKPKLNLRVQPVYDTVAMRALLQKEFNAVYREILNSRVIVS